MDDSHALTGSQFTITLTVLDHDGGSSNSSLPVTVLNVVPTVSGITVTSNGAPVAGAVFEGTKLKVSGTYADAGAIDQQLIRIYWGDGTNTLASVDSKLKTFTCDAYLGG